jgi:hypothetical protein
VWKVVKVPACELLRPARKPGSKGRSPSDSGQSPPPGAVAREKSSEGVAGGSALGPPSWPAGIEPWAVDQGVIEPVVSCGPQVKGLLSAARGPPSKLSWKELNGTCGLFAKVVASRPVCGFAATLPINRAETP